MQPCTPLKITFYFFSFKFRLKDCFLLCFMKRLWSCVILHWITAPKNLGKCGSPKFIGSEKAILASVWFGWGGCHSNLETSTHFKGSFWQKRVPIFKDFSWNIGSFFTISWCLHGEEPKIWKCKKNILMFGGVFVKNGTVIFGDLLWKSDLLEWQIPICLNMCIPPLPCLVVITSRKLQCDLEG